jgi:hypothetical protein
MPDDPQGTGKSSGIGVSGEKGRFLGSSFKGGEGGKTLLTV